MLCGYQPFQGEDNIALMDDITHARFEFHERYWRNVSAEARSFIRKCLALDPAKRPTATEALNDTWMTTEQARDIDLLDTVRENFNARRTFKSAVSAVRAVNRISAYSISKDEQQQQQE